MAELSGHTIASTYKDLLQVSNSNGGIDATLRNISDGEDTSAPLQLSTTAVKATTGLTFDNLSDEKTGIDTDTTVIYPYDDGESVRLAATKDDNGTETTAYLAEMSDVANLSTKAGDAAYWFDGVDDYIRITTTELQFTSKMSILLDVIPHDLSGNNWFIDGRFGGNSYQVYYSYSSNYVRSTIWQSNNSAIDANSDTGVLSTNILSNIAMVADSSNLQNYINGEPSGSPAVYDGTIRAVNTGVNLSCYDVGFYNNTINNVKFFNLPLSQSEIQQISQSGIVPYKYQNASQTVLTSGTLTVGYRYIIDTYVAGDDFTNVGGTNVTGSEFTAIGTTPTTWTNSSSLRHIGCVADYNPSGIGHYTSVDNSGNNLHGKVNGATQFNIPSGHVQTAIKKNVTDDVTLTNIIPAGYLLRKIVFEETAGNTAIIDLGTTSGAHDVFSQQTITASSLTTVVINKVFSLDSDQTLYLNDDGAGTWNSASIDCYFMLGAVQ